MLLSKFKNYFTNNILFESRSQWFFIFALLLFLMTHLCYISVFNSQQNPNKKILPFALLLFGFGGTIFMLLKNNLGALLMPVTVYIWVILMMALFSYKRHGAVSRKSFYAVFIGALLFIISDTLLALDKFYKPMPLAQLSMMAVYAAAQFLIVKGILLSKT